VYANIQPDEAPVLLSFNFEDEKAWKPFLTRKLKNEFFGE